MTEARMEGRPGPDDLVIVVVRAADYRQEV
jgi:hypothetical protein